MQYLKTVIMIWRVKTFLVTWFLVDLPVDRISLADMGGSYTLSPSSSNDEDET